MAKEKMKRSEILKNLQEKIDNRREEIEEKIVEAWKEAEGYPQGMHIDVCINEDDGKVWRTSALSQSWMTESQWKGDSWAVAIIPCWHIGMDGFDYDFDESVKWHKDFEKLQAEYGKVEDEYFGLINFIEENHPEIIDNLDDEYKSWLETEFFPENASEQLDRFLENLEEDIREIENAENEMLCV